MLACRMLAAKVAWLRHRPPVANRVAVILLAAGLLAPYAACADPADAVATADAATPATSPAPTTAWAAADLSVVAASPAALGTGLAMGPSVRVIRGDTVVWGAELGWVRATEYSPSWAVTHDEFRARALAGLQAYAGRARLIVQVGAGVTALYEHRARAQASRLSQLNVATTSSAWAALPAADLRLGVQLPVYAGWGATVLIGPAFHLRDGQPDLGFTASLAAGWLP